MDARCYIREKVFNPAMSKVSQWGDEYV